MIAVGKANKSFVAIYESDRAHFRSGLEMDQKQKTNNDTSTRSCNSSITTTTLATPATTKVLRAVSRDIDEHPYYMHRHHKDEEYDNEDSMVTVLMQKKRGMQRIPHHALFIHDDASLFTSRPWVGMGRNPNPTTVLSRLKRKVRSPPQVPTTIGHGENIDLLDSEIDLHRRTRMATWPNGRRSRRVGVICRAFDAVPTLAGTTGAHSQDEIQLDEAFRACITKRIVCRVRVAKNRTTGETEPKTFTFNSPVVSSKGNEVAIEHETQQQLIGRATQFVPLLTADGSCKIAALGHTVLEQPLHKSCKYQLCALCLQTCAMPHAKSNSSKSDPTAECTFGAHTYHLHTYCHVLYLSEFLLNGQLCPWPETVKHAGYVNYPSLHSHSSSMHSSLENTFDHDHVLQQEGEVKTECDICGRYGGILAKFDVIDGSRFVCHIPCAYWAMTSGAWCPVYSNNTEYNRSSKCKQSVGTTSRYHDQLFSARPFRCALCDGTRGGLLRCADPQCSGASPSKIALIRLYYTCPYELKIVLSKQTLTPTHIYAI